MIAEVNVVPNGYKQTDIGLVPNDWEVDNLERFWSVTDWKHVTATFIASGYAVASIKEVQSRFVDLTNANRTDAQFYSLLTEGGRKPRSGDLILSRNATVGEVAQVADWHPPFAMGQDPDKQRRELFEQTATVKGIHPAIIEKDFWVSTSPPPPRCP